MEDAIVLECKTVGWYSSSNVVHDRELFNPRKIGTTSGYFDAPSLRDAMGLVVRENKRLFRLSGSIKTIPAIVSRDAFEGGNIVGANHCQAGADGDIRMVELVDVPNIPVVDHIDDTSIETEASMLANSYLIATKSEIKTEYAQKLREMIVEASQSLIEDPLLERYTSNIASNVLDIRSTENIKYLTNIARIFKPEIESIEIHAPGILDFSFLHDIKNLERFSSTVKTNTRSVFSHLRKHVKTLVTLSMPIETSIGDMSDYVGLEKVRFFNFERHDGVFDAISGLKNVKHLDLESSTYNESVDGLKNLKTLERLTLKLTRFQGDISPISTLPNLETLRLHLPIFYGPVNSLKNLKGLKRLKMTTRSKIDIDLVSTG